jgi:hypothetical protein
MTRTLWLAVLLLLLFLVSCGALTSDIQPTNIPAASETVIVTQSLSDVVPAETSTALESKTPTGGPLTATPAPESPSPTASPSTSATPAGPTQTPTLTPTIRLLRKPTSTQALLGVQPGSPVWMRNFAHPELDCLWMGVAGQVFDIDDTPMMDLVIEFGGELANQSVFGLAITGQAETYGEGGYEFKLADEPIATSGMVWAQVFDLEGNPISAPTYFSTYEDCEKNLVILNFVQAYKLPTDWFYLPIIFTGEK